MSSKRLKQFVFPYSVGVDRETLIVVDSTPYSITRPHHGRQIVRIIQRNTRGELSSQGMTEICSNVGGDTISFAQVFRHTISYEVQADACAALTHNLRQYGLLDKVTVLCQPFSDQDITTPGVYIDPPWEGSTGVDAHVCLGPTPIFLLARRILERNSAVDWIVLKLPPHHSVPTTLRYKKYLLKPKRNVMILFIKRRVL